MDDAVEAIAAWPTGRLLSTAARLVEHAWNERLQELGLTHAGVIALAVLGDDTVVQTELAARCRVEDQTMSRIVERLERQGHVERRRDPNDRRRLLVARTAAGTAALDGASAVEAEVVPAVSDPQLFRAQLEQVVGALLGGRHR